MIPSTTEQKIKRLLSHFIPLGGWRIRASLHHGLERISGRSASILTVGGEQQTRYFVQRFLAEEQDVEHFGRIPLWKLPAFLERLQSSVDLTILNVDRLLARLLSKQNYLVSPAWAGSWMPVPEDIYSLARRSSSLADDMRYLRDGRFTSVVSYSDADFALFYERYYVPYAHKRHGQLSFLSSYRDMRRTFKRGCLLWIQHDGERQAGVILENQGNVLSVRTLGFLDGNVGLLQGRLTAAIYFYAIRHGQEFLKANLFFGGSRPSLHDGVFRYKRKWGMILCEHPGTNYETLLHWNHMDGVVANFLSHTAMIHRENSGLSALWVYPENLPLTADRLLKEYNAIKVPGLSVMRILLPGEPPVDFTSPEDVRLINYKSMPRVTPETLGLQL